MNNEIKILIFTSKTCTHCRKLIKILEDKGVAAQLNADMQVLDISDNKELTKKYDITAVPTTVILYNDEIKNKLVGNISKNMLDMEIQRLH